LIGWKIEGFWGALVATLSLYLPSSLLCFVAARSWHKFRGQPWHTAMERGLVPVAAGLIASGVLALFQLSGGSFKVGALIVGVAAVLTWRKKMNPTPLLLVGALIFEALYLAGL
jgi:chromate transporter